MIKVTVLNKNFMLKDEKTDIYIRVCINEPSGINEGPTLTIRPSKGDYLNFSHEHAPDLVKSLGHLLIEAANLVEKEKGV